MSAILLGEGLVCIIFMAPIFYAVAGLIVAIMTYFKNRNKSKLNSFVLIPILLIIAEVNEIKKEPETNLVKTIIVINGHHDINNFNIAPNFLENLPAFFKIGFPKPIAITGTGTNVGDFRKIQFESNTKGIGTLHLIVKERKTL